MNDTKKRTNNSDNSILATVAEPIAENVAKIAKAVESISQTETIDKSPLSIFRDKFFLLDSKMLETLKKGDSQLVPYSLYSMQDFSGKTELDIFKPQPVKTGFNNVYNGEMLKWDYFLVTEIALSICKCRVEKKSDFFTNIEKLMPINASPIGSCAYGEFSLAQESTHYIEDCPVSLFKNGVLVMLPPKMFFPKRTIRLKLKFPTPMPKGTWIRAELRGIRTKSTL